MSFKAGDVEIKKIDLTLNRGIKLDLRYSFLEVQLFEDLFQNCIRGVLTLEDGIDLLSYGPLMGEEIIEFHLITPALQDKKDEVIYTGVVYKVGERITTAENKQIYNIYFTSPEAIANENKKISKYWVGNAAEIVQKIFRDDAYLGTKRAFYALKPSNNITFTSPYWSPFKIINWLAVRSIRKEYPVADFVFFETLNRGYHFNSISSIYENQKDTANYSYGQGESGHADINAQYSSIKEIYVDEVFDYLKRIQSGFYANRLMTANTVTKSIQVTNLDYKTNFSKSPHLNKYPVIHDKSTFAKNAMMVSFVNQQYTFDGQKDFGFEHWLLQRIQNLTGLNNTVKVDIVVPGRFDMGAGRICNIEVELSQIHSDAEKDFKQKYLSGKYLVTAVCHRIQRGGQHEMTLQCVTDSVAASLDEKK